MNRRGWTESEGPRPAVGRRASLAYVSPTGDLALWNDLESYGTNLVRRPALDGGETNLRAQWAAPSGGPAPIGTGQKVQGYGVFAFPYGPVAMGLAEAGGFDLFTYGERILEATTLVGYKHRGVDAGVAGLSVEEALLWVERRAGPFAVAHASGFLGAVESALARPVPERELWWRALLQELQRIYDHLRVIARVAEGASQNVGVAQVQLLSEGTLRILGRLTGHRWGFGALRPGARPTAEQRSGLAARLRQLGSEFDDLWETFLESRTFVDRLQSTGALAASEAIRLGTVGPSLRASGVPWDDRLRSPTAPYTDLFVSLAHEEAGDALARVLVRRAEIRSSLLLTEQLLDRWGSLGDGAVAPVDAVDPGRGISRTEAPSGDLVYDVTVADGKIARIGVRTPSQANWPAVSLCLRGSVFTDFVFAVESFGSSFAETDG